MNLSQDSDDTPIPERRTITEQGDMVSSPEMTRLKEPKPKPPKSPNLENPHRRRRKLFKDSNDKADDKEKLKPRLPKPKKSRVPVSNSEMQPPSAPPPPPVEQEKNETEPRKSKSFLPKPKQLNRKRQKNLAAEESRKTSEIVEDDPPPVSIPSTSRGNNVVGDVRIRDILHAFQDDVVTIKSSQRNKWQEKLEGIQAHLLFPDLEHRKSDTVSGGDGDGGSVPSKWKSAAQLIPRDASPAGNKREERERNQFPVLGLFDLLHRVSCYFSGLLAGLLLWHAIFTISQMAAGRAIELSSLFWVLYWSLTTLLMLVTVLGFIHRMGTDDEFPTLNLSLQLLFPLMIFVAYYGSKAIDLQRQECLRYLEVPTEDLKHVRLTYACDESVAGKNWQSSNYWKISLSFIPAIFSILIYSVLHFFRESASSPLQEVHPPHPPPLRQLLDDDSREATP